MPRALRNVVPESLCWSLMVIFGLSWATKLSIETFRTSRPESEGVSVYELGSGQWDIPELRELLEKVISEKSSFENFRVEHDFPEIGHRSWPLMPGESNRWEGGRN